MPTEKTTDKPEESMRGLPPCAWCGKYYEQHEEDRPKDAPVPRVPCLLLKSGFKAKPRSAEFTPRRLKLIVGSARGKYLVDADTGEDLRLPIMSLTEEMLGVQANVHVTCLVAAVEREG